MTDSSDVNDNLYKGSSGAEEFNKDSAGDMVPLYEEITVMKTEVKEELYDVEMSIEEMDSMNAKEECTFFPEIIFEEKNLELITNPEQLSNENHVVENCENKEEDLEHTKYNLCHSKFQEEVYLRSHYKQCFNPVKKILPENKDAGEIYECVHCTYLTSVREHYLTHINIHSGGVSSDNLTKHKLSSSVKTKLASHNLVHTDEKSFKCTYKNCKCTPGQEQFCDCDTCGYAFTNRHSLKRHILWKHSREPKKYKCSNCNYATRRESHLVRHNLVHTGAKSFNCTYKNCKCSPGQEEFCDCDTCGYTYTNSSNLKQHILWKHSAEPKKYKCSNCNYATQIKSHLVRHNFVHTGEKSFKCTYKNCICSLGQEEFCDCDTCGYASTHNSSLKRHILAKHSTESKKHKCSKCKYTTHIKANLEAHSHLHTGEKPFKCNYKNCKCSPGQEQFCDCDPCGYTFTESSNLRRHILFKHSKEPKKYKCSNCNYATQNKSHLVRHNIVHTGEKSFKCTYKNCKCTLGQDKFCECNTCEYAFVNNSNLKRHIITKHSAEPKKYK